MNPPDDALDDRQAILAEDGDAPARAGGSGALPPDPRAIVNRKTLAARLASLPSSEGGAPDRAAALAIFRDALETGRAEVRRRFEANQDGVLASQELCYLIDQLLRSLHEFAVTRAYPQANPSMAEKLAMVATGGYGRGELAPFSDIDLLFLIPYKRTPFVEQLVEYMLYFLWDLGLKVGHATRTVDECLRQARADFTVMTGLLEARYVAGEQSLYLDLRRRFRKDIQDVSGAGVKFVEAKLAERNARHKKLGDTRYALEPNMKEGKGGLRDLHTLFWIAKFLYKVRNVDALVGRKVLTEGEASIFRKAEQYFWSLRFALHYLAGRPEERLTFDVQPRLAEQFGYTDHAGARGVERLMRHYFLYAKSVGDLTRIFCAALEAQHTKRLSARLSGLPFFRKDVEGFRVDADRLSVADADLFKKDPVALIRLFEVAQRHDLDIHPATLRLVTRNARLVDQALRDNQEANRLFLQILTSEKAPEAALRRMGEAGVLGRFIPDFGRVVAQMQYDMYHSFTVDEHTLMAIGILHRIEQGALSDEVPIASDVVHKIQSRRVLYVALFLHDIAKGRGGDHSELGADIAHELCPRLGFEDWETETVAWLVRYHLLMSNTAFKRDIDDPQTIADFAAEVQSLERLRLLLVLTVADIRAVGPRIWNGWKAQLLRDLYYRTEEYLSGGLTGDATSLRAVAAQRTLEARLSHWPHETVERHLSRASAAYWLGFDADTLERHATLVRTLEESDRPFAVEFRIDRWRAVTEATVATRDRAGLFARLAGAFALAGASIVEARINTFSDGLALDAFSLQEGGGAEIGRQEGAGRAIEEPDRLARIERMIARMLAEEGPVPLLEFPPSPVADRFSLFRVAPRVLIDNAASAAYTVIEVNGRDRRGFLYALTRTLSELKLQIASAKISTFGARAIDVFYVKDQYGLKIENEKRIEAIRAALMAALEDPNQAVPPPSPKATELATPANFNQRKAG
jgi:[protein-PII] uridylyltransferase